MLKRVIAYKLSANLLQENGKTFWFDFTVMARNYIYAETVLEKYLTENKKDTGLIYKEVVGIRNTGTESIVMDILEDNHIIVDKSSIINE